MQFRRRRKIPSFVFACIVGWCVCILIYGFARYPDAPPHLCGEDKFCGKQGQAHTRVEYAAFQLWERLLMFSWPFGMLSAFVLARRKQATSR